MHRDGAYRHVKNRTRTVFDKNGRPERAVGFAIDVTAQHREMALRQIETRLQKFAGSNVIGVIFGDIHGGISYANNEFVRIALTREEFVTGQIGWATVTPPEWLPADEAAIAQAKAGDGTCTPYEKEYVRKDGSRISVLVGFTLFGESETVAFILDISERKRAKRKSGASIKICHNPRPCWRR